MRNSYNSEDKNTEISKWDALDLVEFCRGGADTKWGAVRIAMGHEATFELKYIGIGNEQWSNTYFEHYEAFLAAFKKAAEENDLYKEIELVVANGQIKRQKILMSD